jgi:signal recognition particle subunit SRP68
MVVRCLNLAFAYSLDSSYYKAQQLLDRAKSLSSQASRSLASSAPSSEGTPLRLDISTSRLESLQSSVSALLLASASHIATQKHHTNSSAATSAHLTSAAPLYESLSTFPSTGVLDLQKQKVVEYPPSLKPVSIKPLFLDTAWGYIEYEGKAKKMEGGAVNGTGEQRQQAAEGTQQQQQGRGWFGFGRR